MNEEGCARFGAACRYRDEHELTLVATVLQAIGAYNQQSVTDPCPDCLREAMLAVAALLHLEAAKLRSGQASPLDATAVTESFIAAARGKLQEVMEVSLEALPRSPLQ